MRPWLRVSAAMLAVGWGANQFSPLLIVYRDQKHLSPTVVTALFGAYVVGLVPALLLGASFSDRLGRVRVMRAVMVLSAVASAILASGADTTWVLAVGRLVAGVASGAAFGPGSAWIKELSADAGPGAGARRAAVALSAGFGGGPLVSGALAQWLPAPAVVPYVVHIALTLVVAPLMWNAPETVHLPAVAAPVRRRELRRTLTHPEFLRRIVPAAPFAFGAATTGFVVLPSLLPVSTAPVAITGGTAALTLGTSVVVQPFARRLERRRAGSVLTFGLVLATAGFLLAALAVRVGRPVLMMPADIVLGAAFGMLLVGGLSGVEALADADDLAAVTAVFYCLTYLGFVVPYVFAAVDRFAPPTLPFMVTAAAVALILVVTGSRRSVVRPA